MPFTRLLSVAAALALVVALACDKESAPRETEHAERVPYCIGDSYCLSSSHARAGASISATGPLNGPNEDNGRGEGGRSPADKKIEFWWNLAPRDWVDVVGQHPPEGAYLLERRGFAEGPPERFRISLRVPLVDPGRYPLILILYAGRSATSIPYEVRVDALAAP